MAKPPLCQEGETRTCSCAGGADGASVCLSGGDAYSECSCELSVGPAQIWEQSSYPLRAIRDASLADLLLETPLSIGGQTEDFDLLPCGQLGADRAPCELDVPTDSGNQRMRLVWGVMHSGTHEVWTQQAVVDYLGRDSFVNDKGGLELPLSAGGTTVSQAEDFFRCKTTRSPAAEPAPEREGDAQALRDSAMTIRMIHPFVVAIPVDASGPAIRTDKSYVVAAQHATTGTGFDWLAFSAAPAQSSAGTNDVVPLSSGMLDAIETGARHGAATIWLGDTILPHRWGAYDPQAIWGSSCETKPGWADGNEYVGLMSMALAKLSHHSELSADDIIKYGAFPYARPRIAAATLLQGLIEREYPAATIPQQFMVVGGSKGGMGCLYTVLSDQRFQAGACAVYDIYDLEADASLIDRFESDWGICARGGYTEEGCPTRNMPNSGPPEAQSLWRAQTAAGEKLRDAVEPARFLDKLEYLNPGAKVWMLNASTDFHYPVGLNSDMWLRRPPNPEVFKTVTRMNGDHGSYHVVPDDGVEPLSLNQWIHGADEEVVRQAFFSQQKSPSVVWETSPTIDAAGRLRGRAKIFGGRGSLAGRFYLARSSDRDFSFCTGMELDDAVMCVGKNLCRQDLDACGVPSESCSGKWVNAANNMPLLQHTSADQYCVWRTAPGGDYGSSYAQFCTDPDIDGEFDVADVERDLYGANPSTDEAYPGTWRFVGNGATSSEALFSRWGYVYPYRKDENGDYLHANSGMFMPVDGPLTQDGANTYLELDIDLGLAAGDNAHVAIAAIGWDAPDDGMLAAMVSTDIRVVDVGDDSDRLVCSAE